MSMLITTHLEIVLVTLLSLLMAVVVLQQRRSPQSAVAWLLFMIVVPYLALPLFLLLGFRKQSGRFAPIVFIPEMAADDSGGPKAARLDHVFHEFGLPAARPGHDFTLLAVRFLLMRRCRPSLRRRQTALMCCSTSWPTIR